MYLILDTETNSYHPGQIAQLSYILTDDQWNFQKSNNFFFRVDVMDPYAESIHGFSKEMLEQLSQGKTFSDRQENLIPLLDAHTLVAHNAWFDKKFIQYEYERLWLTYNPELFCTMQYFTPICQLPHHHNGGYKRPKLSELLGFYNISESQVQQTSQELFDAGTITAHDARFDTTALYLVMQEYKKTTELKVTMNS